MKTLLEPDPLLAQTLRQGLGRHPWVHLRADDAAVCGPRPFERIADEAGARRVQVDVADLAVEMCAVPDDRGLGNALPYVRAVSAKSSSKNAREPGALSFGVLGWSKKMQVIR